MKKLTKEDAENIYRQVAMKNNTTVDEVKRQIKLAMLIGMCHQEPEIQRKWDSISHDGDVPTPEELLIFLSSEARKKMM